jgi:hypothetical protein
VAAARYSGEKYHTVLGAVFCKIGGERERSLGEDGSERCGVAGGLEVVGRGLETAAVISGVTAGLKTNLTRGSHLSVLKRKNKREKQWGKGCAG